jgi:hypothetical protein
MPNVESGRPVSGNVGCLPLRSLTSSFSSISTMAYERRAPVGVTTSA